MKNESLPLDFSVDESLSGFRLQRLEVFNWGTFDSRVWTLRADGRNALLTGDIGSGKSTLVDAVTTLLVPAHRVAYNKAAGAEARERSLRSYVLGHYKAARSDLGASGRPVALRGPNSYSVILAVFHNAGYDQTVTLAQVFWLKDPAGQPLRLYAVAEKDLGITADFADFGTATAARLKEREAEQARSQLKLEQARALRAATQQRLDAPDFADHQQQFGLIEGWRAEALGEHQLSVESCDGREQDMRRWLQERIDADDKRQARLTEKIVRAMAEYKEAFKLETQEVDASVVAVGEYRSMLAQLQADDLPRFEARFKELLNENTIREVAHFQSQLHRERETIKERVARINESLTQIDYNPGRYIALEAQPATDADVRDFQTELRACTEGTLTGSDDAQYSEGQVPAGQAHHRTLPRPRGLGRVRSPLGGQGDGRAAMVPVRRQRTLARRRQRARALRRFRRQVGRPEGEAGLHHPGRQPGLPVRAGMGRRAFALLPLRGHRRGLRPRLRRIGGIRPASLQAVEPATADRHAAAEDPHHRALRGQRRLRAQRGRQQLEAAQPGHRGIPGAARHGG
jgi:uncharacterized protein YPO0396